MAWNGRVHQAIALLHMVHVHVIHILHCMKNDVSMTLIVWEKQAYTLDKENECTYLVKYHRNTKKLTWISLKDGFL